MKTNNYLKNILLLIILFNCWCESTAQITEVISGLSNPQGLAVDGAGNLYISESGTIDGDKISFMHLPDQQPVRFELFTNLNKPGKLTIDNNYLYVTEIETNRILRFNLLVSPPQLLPYISTGLISPIGLSVKDNLIIVGNYGSYTISKINTSTTPFQSSTVINDLATDIIIDGDNFYYTNPAYGRVQYNSISNPSPINETLITQLTEPASLALYDNYLYIADQATGNIYRINTSGGSTFPQQIISELNNPQSMVVYENELYIAERGAGRIVKLNLSALSNSNFENDTNPVVCVDSRSNTLTVHSVKNLQMKAISNVLGQRTNISERSEHSIDISAIPHGVYWLEVLDENNQSFSLKFIK